MAERPRVGFIGGLGRSGSTLLELCLAGLPGVCGVGELVHVWERGVVGNQLCGCGQAFHDCAFWRQVGALAFGGWERVDVERVVALKRSVDRNRFVPRLLGPWPGSAFLRTVREYSELYRRIYSAALQVAHADVVIDSSKHASLAACLRWDRDLDLRLVHVTRDSRGVAHSWSKQVRRPEISDSVVYMPQYSATYVSVRWLTQNTMLEALGAFGVTRLHVRYEDFVDDPAGTVRRVARYLDLPEPAGEPGSLPGQVMLTRNHTVAGNPLRFATGAVEVHADEAWRQGMSAARRRLVGAVTLPLRLRYGYVGEGREVRPPPTATSLG
jgi:hypothetical protein